MGQYFENGMSFFSALQRCFAYIATSNSD